MERHLIVAMLVGFAALTGGNGADGLARLALLIALPIVSFAAIAAFAEVRSGRGDDRVHQPLLSMLIAVAVLGSCVLRSSVVGPTPHLAVSLLEAALVLYALKGCAALAPSLRRLGASWPAKP